MAPTLVAADLVLRRDQNQLRTLCLFCAGRLAKSMKDGKHRDVSGQDAEAHGSYGGDKQQQRHEDSGHFTFTLNFRRGSHFQRVSRGLYEMPHAGTSSMRLFRFLPSFSTLPALTLAAINN